MTLGHPPVLIDIVEEHFEELDFLWEHRERIVFAPDYNLEELAEHEERAEAHLDGLRLAELHGVEIARPALAGDETFAATAATFVFMETGVPDLVNEVVDAFEAAADPAARDGIRIGLRHSKIDLVRDRILGLVQADDEALAAAAADVAAFHRLPLADLGRLRGAEDPAARVLAYGTLGRTRSLDRMDDLRHALGDSERDVRVAALAAAALSGLAGLDELCRRAARSADEPEATAFLGVVGRPDDAPLLQQAARRPETGRAALDGLGALGQVDAIPVLIELMNDEALALDAASAFKRITGADDVDREPSPPEPEPEPDADAEPAPETEDEGDDEPRPDPEKAKAWWADNRAHFAMPGRWQAGREVSGALGTLAFNELPLETRRDLYRCARAQGGSVPELELEARAIRQGG